MWLLLIEKRTCTILFKLKLYHKLPHLLLLISFVGFSFAAVFSLVSFCFITAAHQGLIVRVPWIAEERNLCLIPEEILLREILCCHLRNAFFLSCFWFGWKWQNGFECDCGIFSAISGICFSMALLDSHQHCLRVCSEVYEAWTITSYVSLYMPKA